MSKEDPLPTIQKQNDILIAWKEQHNTLDGVNGLFETFYLNLNKLRRQRSLSRLEVSYLRPTLPQFQKMLEDYEKSQTLKPPNMEWTKKIRSTIQEIETMLDNIEQSMIKTVQPILIVTVKAIETEAILNVFSVQAALARFIYKSKIYYNLGVHGGAEIFMMQSEMGTATPNGALLKIYQAIQDIDPQAVIMCGTAYGLRPDKQNLGDILIARQLLSYELQKIDGHHSPTFRGDRTTVSDRLLGYFNSVALERKNSPTHFGLVLSGEKQVNDPIFRDLLLKAEPEAIGVEMEGTGLYVAARPEKVDWILVKAIRNWANKNDVDDSHSQALTAANNAAQFVWYILQQSGMWDEKRITNYRSGIVADRIFEQLEDLSSATNDLWHYVRERMTYVDKLLKIAAEELKRLLDTPMESGSNEEHRRTKKHSRSEKSTQPITGELIS